MFSRWILTLLINWLTPKWHWYVQNSLKTKQVENEDAYKHWLQCKYRTHITRIREQTHEEDNYFPLKTEAMLVIVLSNNESEHDFAHRNTAVSVSEDIQRQCNIIVCCMPRMQHEYNASFATTKKQTSPIHKQQINVNNENH